MGKPMSFDKAKVRTEYETTNATLIQLAKKYNVSLQTLRRYSAIEDWKPFINAANLDKINKKIDSKIDQIVDEKTSGFSDVADQKIRIQKKILDVIEDILNSEDNPKILRDFIAEGIKATGMQSQTINNNISGTNILSIGLADGEEEEDDNEAYQMEQEIQPA